MTRTIVKIATLCTVLAAAIPPVFAADDCELDLVDGEITEHKYTGFHRSIRVSVPAQRADEHGYPVIVYYHGWSTGLKPNLRIMSAVTGGEDYLMVGMSYRTKYFYQELDRESLRKEIIHFDAVLDDLERCRPVNRQAVFLAGYSQGGYAISMIGEQRIDSVAGMVILGSGRRLAKMYLPEPEEVEGWPIFIAAGVDDEQHFPVADNTAKLYAILGAEVTLEKWPDTDHFQGWAWYQKEPERGANLKNWLDNIVANRTSLE